MVRVSISFPVNIYQSLEDLAKKRKVSLAWVVRDAAQKYVAHQKRTPRKRRGERKQDG